MLMIVQTIYKLGGIGAQVSKTLHDMTGLDTRETVLGHVQRGELLHMEIGYSLVSSVCMLLILSIRESSTKWLVIRMEISLKFL